MNKEYIIKKLADLNTKTGLEIHTKLSQIVTNSFRDSKDFGSNEVKNQKITFDINIDDIKTLMNKTEIEKVSVPPVLITS